MEKFKRFTLFCLTFLLFDFGAGRFYTAFHTPKPDPVRISSNLYHHDFKPNSEKTETWGGNSFRLITNSLGFRDFTTRSVGLKKTGKRILLMGDSFTEGIGIDYEKTFAGRITARLEPLGVEVFNAGVSSYSPALYLRKSVHLIETLGLEADEVFVFLDTSDPMNELDYARKPRARERAMRVLAENSMGIRLLRNLRARFSKNANPEKKKKETRNLQDLWSFDDGVYTIPAVQEGLKLERLHMDQLLSLLKKHHIKMTVVVYPWPIQILSGTMDQKQESVWVEWCRQNGVPLINLFPFFMNGTDPKEMVDRYFIPGDIHWNADGHQKVAEILWQETNGFQISSSSDS